MRVDAYMPQGVLTLTPGWRVSLGPTAAGWAELSSNLVSVGWAHNTTSRKTRPRDSDLICRGRLWMLLFFFFSLKDLFDVDHFFFKVFTEFVTILLLFPVLVFWLRGMWDLSSRTRDQTHTPCIGRRSLNHWTGREVPTLVVLILPPIYPLGGF